jgi:hypothetical protein
MAASAEYVRPRGDATTVLDLADRDGQDDTLFPLDSDLSWFSRDMDRRSVEFTSQLQTFIYKGSAQFGGFLTFDVSQAGDLIHMIGLQVKLPHWLDPGIRAALEAGNLVYQDPTAAWTYANGIGRTLIQHASIQVDDTTLERIDTVGSDIIFKTFPDSNKVFGFGRDSVGIASAVELATPPSAPANPAAAASIPPSGMFDPRRPYSTDRGEIICLIPFFFTRNANRSAFPLVSMAEGRTRINVQLAPWADVIRACAGTRATCDASPLGRTFNFVQPDLSILTAYAPTDPPPFEDFRLIVYSSILGNEVREPYIRRPFEIMYRELSSFPFAEPLKYAILNGVSDQVHVQLPIEANHPVEEILWVVRRTAQANNNDWLNYSSYTERELTPALVPQEPVVEAAIMINGLELVRQPGQWFRAHIGRHHKGGIVPYRQYIYGYSFAKTPGAFTPSGTANLSRSQSVRLNLTVRVPAGSEAKTWEVFVYTFGLNWLRFQNGMCGRIFNN